MSDDHDLRKRRQALETELAGLSDQQERGFRANADAVNRLPAGVIEPEAAETPEFAASELAAEERAADSAMEDLRDQIDLIDDELVHSRQFGVTQHDASSMSEFADDEAAADSAIADLRRQIDAIDHELARSEGVTGAGSRVLWWLRK
jgi:hypothetical protein